MHKSSSRYACLAAAVLVISLGNVAHASKSPHLDAAIEYMKQAKTADNPIAPLKAAIHQLNVATNSKGGKKEDVVVILKQAIQDEQSGDKDGANKLIDHGMAEVYAAANHRGGWE